MRSNLTMQLFSIIPRLKTNIRVMRKFAFILFFASLPLLSNGQIKTSVDGVDYEFSTLKDAFIFVNTFSPYKNRMSQIFRQYRLMRYFLHNKKTGMEIPMPQCFI
jgi:hypothetical protein